MTEDTWTRDDTIWLVAKTVAAFIGVVALAYVIFRFVQARRRGEPGGRALLRALGEALPSAGMLALGALMVGAGAAVLVFATELWRAAQDPVLMIATFGIGGLILFIVGAVGYVFGVALIGLGITVILGGGASITGFWASRRAKKRGWAAPPAPGQWDPPPPLTSVPSGRPRPLRPAGR